MKPEEFSPLDRRITVQIVGMRSLENLRENLQIARNFKPLTPAEMDALATQLPAVNVDERYTFYRRAGYRDGDEPAKQPAGDTTVAFNG